MPYVRDVSSSGSTGWTLLPLSLLLWTVFAAVVGPRLLPAATLVVSPQGNDAAAGDADHPFRTISRAAKFAMPGDTVFVRAGVYRERVAPPRGGEEGKPITYRGEKLGSVFIRGSEEWRPRWQTHEGTVYFGVPEESLFNDRCYLDNANPFRVELALTPGGRNGKPEKERFGWGDAGVRLTCGQVFVNGELYRQAPYLSEVEERAKSWAFDSDTGRIYVNFGVVEPAEQRVEITTRRRIFAPHVRGLGHIVVEGFVLEHCGNQYPTNFWNTPIWAQAGALGLRAGHHWAVRNNVIRYANTIAIDVGAAGGDNEQPLPVNAELPPSAGHDNLFEYNYVVDNGAAGIIGSDSTRAIIRHNVILRNNSLRFDGPKRYEHAGIKCHNIKDGLIENNYIADNPINDGVWLDNRFPGTRVTRNVIVNNGGKGVFLEMSDYDFDTAMVDHNILVGNMLIQYYVHDASGATAMHNLIANSPSDSRHGQGAYIYQVTARTRTYHHSLFNNLFVNHKTMLDINYPSHRGGPQRLDHNVFDASPDERVFLINSAADKPSPWSPTDFIAMVHEELGELSPGLAALDGENKATMTLIEWRAFWEKHGLDIDQHSRISEGMTVSYDPAGCEVVLEVPFDPTTVGSTNHKWIDDDFFGEPVPQEGNVLPGPFQNLRQGENRYRVWDGLPILAAGRLPE